MKKGLLAGGIAVALLAVGALTSIFFVRGHTAAASARAQATPVHVEGKLGPSITLDDRVFNLANGPGGAKHFLKLQTTVEFDTTDPGWYRLSGAALTKAQDTFDKETIGDTRKIIEDVVTNVVSAKTADDISTTAGKDQLRDELRAAINARVHQPTVYRVLFTSFVTD